VGQREPITGGARVAPDDTKLGSGVLVDCPTCHLPAEITDRLTLDGVPEPVEHVKVVYVRWHWYTLPVDRLAVPTRVSEPTSTSA
jgi:hypothetical protein